MKIPTSLAIKSS